MGLALDFSFLSAEGEQKRETASAPPSLWKPVGTPDQQREEACLWLADCAVAPHPREGRQRLQIEPISRQAAAAELSIGTTMLAVSASEMRRRYLIDYDRGYGTGEEQLNGLFGFLQAIVWPMWINQWCSSRIQIEKSLPAVTEAAVQRYRQFEASKRQLLKESNASMLVNNRRSRGLYDAAINQDAVALRRYKWAWRRYDTGVEEKHLREYIQFIDADNRKMISERKLHMQYCLLMPILKKRLKAGLEWHTPAYQHMDQQSESQLAALTEAATRFYSSGFRSFCLRDDVRAMERDLFGTARWPNSRPYEELINELAQSQTPLSAEQQVLQGSNESPPAWGMGATGLDRQSTASA
jgi:hypothetical protein